MTEASSKINPNFQAEERNKAIELFHQGKYADALPIFKKLSDSYPSDYLLKYFTGACLVETGVYTKETEMFLLLSGTRDVPAKVFYYLARYYHANEDWDNALRFYNRYRNNSQPGDYNQLRIEELTELVYQRINPFTRDGIKMPEKKEPVMPAKTEEVPTAQVISSPEIKNEKVSEQPAPQAPVEDLKKEETVPVVHEEIELSQQENPQLPLQTEIIPAQPAIGSQPTPQINFIRFQVNPQVTYLTEDMFQVAEAKQAWKTGANKEKSLNDLLGSLTDLRRKYQQTTSQSQRDQLANQIIEMERQTLILRAETDQLYQKARQLEQQWWADADYTVYEKFNSITDSLRRLEEAQKQAALPPPPVISETILIEEPIQMDEEESSEDHGVTYKVQLGSFTRAVPARTQALFDKISKIRPIETFVNDEGATVYTTGNMKTYADGLALQNQVRVEGVKDAFVIAIKDGKRISLPEAKKLTGEE